MNWSVLKAAREWGIDRETLARRLVAAGFKVDARSEFHTKQITSAIHGSLQMERIRLTRAQADKAETEKLERAGILITEQRAREVMTAVLGPIRSAIAGLPALAPRCNPAEPARADKVLQARARELLEAAQMGPFEVQSSKFKVRSSESGIPPARVRKGASAPASEPDPERVGAGTRRVRGARVSRAVPARGRRVPARAAG